MARKKGSSKSKAKGALGQDPFNGLSFSGLGLETSDAPAPVESPVDQTISRDEGPSSSPAITKATLDLENAGLQPVANQDVETEVGQDYQGDAGRPPSMDGLTMETTAPEPSPEIPDVNDSPLAALTLAKGEESSQDPRLPDWLPALSDTTDSPADLTHPSLSQPSLSPTPEPEVDTLTPDQAKPIFEPQDPLTHYLPTKSDTQRLVPDLVKPKSKQRPRPDTRPSNKQEPHALDSEPTRQPELAPQPDPVEAIAPPWLDLNNLIATVDADVKAIFGDDVVNQLPLAQEAPQEASEPLPDEVNEALLVSKDETEEQGLAQEQYLIFKLNGVDYAILAESIREVGEATQATALPNVPYWLLGVTNLRGEILSLVDLGAFLGIRPVGPGEGRQLMVINGYRSSPPIKTGLIVDEIVNIQYLPTTQIRVPSTSVEQQVASYLRGVYQQGQQLIMVLDFERLLNSAKMRQFEIA